MLSELDKVELKLRLKNFGVRLNKKLSELIESLEKEQVQNVVSVVEESLATDKKVTSKAGLFKKHWKKYGSHLKLC